MGDNSLRELFPSAERIAIGGSDPRCTNTVEGYHNARQAILRDILRSVLGLRDQGRLYQALQALRG